MTSIRSNSSGNLIGCFRFDQGDKDICRNLLHKCGVLQMLKDECFPADSLNDSIGSFVSDADFATSIENFHQDQVIDVICRFSSMSIVSLLVLLQLL